MEGVDGVPVPTGPKKLTGALIVLFCTVAVVAIFALAIAMPSLLTGAGPGDIDKDGVPDSSDAFPNDPLETLDTDNDGHGDNSDMFRDDPSEWMDSDRDGRGDNSDDYPLDPTRQDEPDLRIVEVTYTRGMQAGLIDFHVTLGNFGDDMETGTLWAKTDLYGGYSNSMNVVVEPHKVRTFTLYFHTPWDEAISTNNISVWLE